MERGFGILRALRLYDDAIRGYDALRAVWAPVEFTIQFYANGGSGTQMDAFSMIYDRFGILPANTYTRSGYIFIGWSKNQSDGKPLYLNMERAVNIGSVQSEEIYLYAVWVKIPIIDGSTVYSQILPSPISYLAISDGDGVMK